MNTKSNSLPSPSGKWFIAGLLAMTVLTTRLHAQYVSTLISNGLAAPYGVAVDSSFNLYIANTYSNCILKYVPSTKTVSVLAGQDGSPGGTANGTGTAAQFNQPMGLVFARGGLVVVDQYNQQLRYVSLAGAVSNLAGQTGVIGSGNGPALGGAQFCNPAGIAVAPDGQTLYIADQGNNSIRKLSSNNVVSTVVTSYTQNGVSHNFKSPAAVAVDTSSNLWIADSYNHVICVVTNGTSTAYGVAGTYRVHGTNDGPASTALFYLPSGLMWDSSSNILVISDTDNATVRALFVTNSIYEIETLAGLPGVHGNVDGSLSTAEFGQPFGLCTDPTDAGYYVGDVGNNTVRVLEPTQPPPAPLPIPAPVIGYVTFTQVNSEPSAQFNPFTQPVSVFNNAVQLAIEQLDGTVETFMSYGPTGSTIPPPGSNTFHVQAFTQINVGQPPPVPTISIVTNPANTIEAVSIAPGRPTSPAVSVQVDFVTANPTISGDNSEDILFTDVTTNAAIYYTTNGTTPAVGSNNTLGPVYSGQVISFAVLTNTTVTAQAIAPGFGPSGYVTAVFSPTNFEADRMTFGFASGEGSSKFLTAPGQTFIAPVTMSLIPSAEVMYTLQFSLAITNLGTHPVFTSGSNGLTFSSMLMEPIPDTSPPLFEQIPPAMAGGYTITSNIVTNVVTNSFVTNFTTNYYLTNLVFTNLITNELLGVGWLERPPNTNLYNTKNQTLITYSQAHDTVFSASSGQVIVGGYAFTVPTSATNGEEYEIQVGSPSATSDGIGTPVYIVTVTNGSLTNGAINSTKVVIVTNQNPYLVGDVSPFYWFNAGDFGDGLLQNDDVTETFQTGVYGLNGPNAATQRSDYFDAMDSSNGTTNNAYDGNNDAIVNSILYGDGVIAVDDVYVTYRRSLDPALNWVYRYDSSSGKKAYATNTGLSQPFTGAVVAAAGVSNSSGARYISVAADQVVASANQTVSIPVRILAADSLPVSTLMLRVEVDALDGSPMITNQIGFSANTNLGTMFDSATPSLNDFSAVWLNVGGPGISGTNIVGTVTVPLPVGVNADSAYLVHFDHFSASPNGVGLFHCTVQDGLITLSDRSGSSWHDGIPDSWRLLWFNSVSNALSAATADPDGDGANNYQEYVAGTNPNDPASVFQFLPGSSRGPSTFTLQWPSVVNKHYSVQASYTMFPGKWSTIATNIVGTGQSIQWTDNNAAGKTQFYRAIVQ